MNLGHHIFRNRVYARTNETVCSADIPEVCKCPLCEGKGEMMLLRTRRIKDGKEEILRVPPEGVSVVELALWNSGHDKVPEGCEVIQ
jgi:hypothetical protein